MRLLHPRSPQRPKNKNSQRRKQNSRKKPSSRNNPASATWPPACSPKCKAPPPSKKSSRSQVWATTTRWSPSSSTNVNKLVYTAKYHESARRKGVQSFGEIYRGALEVTKVEEEVKVDPKKKGGKAKPEGKKKWLLTNGKTIIIFTLWPPASKEVSATPSSPSKPSSSATQVYLSLSRSRKERPHPEIRQGPSPKILQCYGRCRLQLENLEDTR